MRLLLTFLAVVTAGRPLQAQSSEIRAHEAERARRCAWGRRALAQEPPTAASFAALDSVRWCRSAVRRPLERLWRAVPADTGALFALAEATTLQGDRATLGAIADVIRDPVRPLMARRTAVTTAGLFLDPRAQGALLGGLREGRYPSRPLRIAVDHPDYTLVSAMGPGVRDSLVALLRALAEDPAEDSTLRVAAAALAYDDLRSERWSIAERASCRRTLARLGDSLPGPSDFVRCPDLMREAFARAWRHPAEGDALEALLYLAQAVRDDSVARTLERAAANETLPHAMRFSALHALATQGDPALYQLRTEYMTSTPRSAWRCGGWWVIRHHAVFIDGPELVPRSGDRAPRGVLRELGRTLRDPTLRAAATFLSGCIRGELATQPPASALGAPPPWGEGPPMHAALRSADLGAPTADASAVAVLGPAFVPMYSNAMPNWAGIPPSQSRTGTVEGLRAPEAVAIVGLTPQGVQATVVPITQGPWEAAVYLRSAESFPPWLAMLPVPPSDDTTGAVMSVLPLLGGTAEYRFPPITATELRSGARSGEGIVGMGRMVVVTGAPPECELLVAVGTDGANWLAVPIGEFRDGVGRARLRLRSPDPRIWVYRIAWPTPGCGSATVGALISGDSAGGPASRN